MRTTRFLGCLAVLTVALHASAQVAWDTNGNTINGGEWFGADNSSTVPLMIRHNANQPIDWYTDAVRRMSLLPDATYTIGGFPNQVKDGTLLLSPNVANFYGSGAPGPFTGLHLHDGGTYVQQGGYRSNMGNGVTLTGNGDQMYVGQLYHGYDYTDAAIVWSDNPGNWLADRLTFNFTSSYNSSAVSGNNSFNGLQTLLIQPDGNGQEAYVGLGDFDAASAAPQERLDVLDGRVRIRQLPTDPEANALNRFMVVDNTGVVKWRHLPPWATNGCEWEMNTSSYRLTTARRPAGTNGNCPDARWKVGIGTASPQFKLEVIDVEADTVPTIGGLRVDLRTDHSGWRYGIKSYLEPKASGAQLDYGVSVLGDVANVGLS